MANGTPKLDLIITGDRVIDPSSGLDGPAQIHVTNGKIVSLSEDLSLQSAGRHIDATGMIVCPGLIDTEMVKNTINEDDIIKYANSFPIQRLGKATEVASLVLFLASDKADYITGASLDINGGDLMI